MWEYNIRESLTKQWFNQYECLGQRRLIGTEGIGESVNRSLIILAGQGLCATLSEGTKRPGTYLLIGTVVITLENSGVQSIRYNTLLHPASHNLQVSLREGSVGLSTVAGTMSGSGHQEETVPLFKLVGSRGLPFDDFAESEKRKQTWQQIEARVATYSTATYLLDISELGMK